MISKAETVIASIAHNLTKMGSSDVALLEKGYLAWGATGKSSAIVNIGVWNASKPLLKMSLPTLSLLLDISLFE